jgi:hypothetical protein
VNGVYRKETRILLEKRGIPVAAIIAADDLKRFARLEREGRSASSRSSGCGRRSRTCRLMRRRRF